MEFTAHNILLPDGTKTMPDLENLTANTSWMKSTHRVLQLAYGCDIANKSIVDLGCLEGGYALEFAKLGMSTTGIEVRESNFRNCMIVKENFPDLRLAFHKDNVWNAGKYGMFDVGFCCGLLYHLDRPVEFIKYMSESIKHVFIINTHYALETDTEQFNLSHMTVNEGFRGRWFGEHDCEDEDKLEKLKWASWENKRSFWLTKQSIMQVMFDCGFDMVFEQVDILAPSIVNAVDSGYYDINCRSMFVGVRSGI